MPFLTFHNYTCHLTNIVNFSLRVKRLLRVFLTSAKDVSFLLLGYDVNGSKSFYHLKYEKQDHTPPWFIYVFFAKCYKMFICG